jgi:hypothetical protein
MSEGEVYCVMNLEKYAKYMRDTAAASFAKNYTDKLDDFVTIAQVCKMIKENSIGQDEEGRELLDDKAHEEIAEALRVRIHNAGVSKLAASDHLECAWDDKKNEMVFWVKGEEKD